MLNLNQRLFPDSIFYLSILTFFIYDLLAFKYSIFKLISKIRRMNNTHEIKQSSRVTFSDCKPQQTSKLSKICFEGTKNKLFKKHKRLKTQKRLQIQGQSQPYNFRLDIMNTRQSRLVKERLFQLYGKNFPINYRRSYNFDEQWQNNVNIENNVELIQSHSLTNIEIILSILTIVTFALVIWITNINFFFHIDHHQVLAYTEIYATGFIVEIINGVFKLKKIQKKQMLEEKLKQILGIFYVQFVTIPYFLTKILIDSDNSTTIWVIFQGIIWIVLYFQASKRYYSLRLMSFCLYYQYQTKLFDMILTMFIASHFISIILYSSTKIHPESSWLFALDINHQDPLIIYVYSMYFSITTITSVGYGDVSPKNYAEVIVVSMIQISGIVMFGYMINQIGYCISSLRRNRQTIEKDLFLIQKMKNHYKMNENLINKVRSYLVYTKPKLDQVSPQEQKGILMKLNQQIRQSMLKQNMDSVLRSSIFFLCRWTKHFQGSISTNLVHIMANPNDILYQPHGKERIYIIKSGKININSEMGSAKGINTPLKSIQIDKNKEVSDNCYGYSIVISTRSPKLYAVSKDFTSCYYVEKPNFLSCVNEKRSDFEYYHQIKSKMDQARSCESFEAPLLTSSKHHYIPSIAFLVKKYRSESKISSQRVRHKRCQKAKFRRMRQAKNIAPSQSSMSDCEISMSDREIYNNRNYRRNLINKQVDKPVPVPAPEFMKNMMEKQRDNFHHYFESGKEYQNYFINHNKQKILMRYQKPSRLQYMVTLRQEESSLQMMQTELSPITNCKIINI